MAIDLNLTRDERLALANANRKDRVANAVAVAKQATLLATLDASLDDDGWADLDLAVRSDGPLDGPVEGECDSGIAGQDLDLAVMG